MSSSWRLLDLGGLEPYRAQALYEAVALTVGNGISPNTLILCHPVEPYVCIGYHQELRKEVDIDFCRVKHLPIIRRSQGGGAVYLDSNQQFYQVVAKRNDPLVPADVEVFLKKFIRPTIHTCQKLGLHAEYKPINDVVIRNRKISGNGAGELGGSAILVGNIIMDMDYDCMSRVLRVPSEKFRDKLAKSMSEWVTSLKREMGSIPSAADLKRLLVEGYEDIGIRFTAGQLADEEERIYTQEIKPKHLSSEWLNQPIQRHQTLVDTRAVRVSGMREIRESTHKVRKLIRITAEILSGRILDILISGDFFVIPENALPKLEQSLVGASLEQDELKKRVDEFYEETNVQTPGIEPQDFVDAIMRLERLNKN